ncbi:uncharacterized protein [Pagrus major]|uniref:uncharacterized protein n=1 Tax=Pagrus major TaxID=143350 RepID=UPI003CC89FFC
MSKTRHQNFRSFLTERFTAAAVEIFEEVEHIVETYYEENKHLRSVLHMVLNPEIKIPRIDEALGRQTGATTNVRELSNKVDLQISEPLPKKLKEEQVDYDINNGLEQQCEEQQGLGETDLFMTPDCVKNDPEEEVEEDTNISCIADSFQVDVVEWSPDTSSTVSADEANEEHPSDGDPKSRSREGAIRKSRKKVKKRRMEKEKPKRSLQKTMLEFPRMRPCKSFNAAPADCLSFLARLTEAYKDFPDDKKPLITKMGLTADVELVDTAFGKAPKGSPLSCQYSVPSSQDYKTNEDAPPRLALPMSNYRLEPPRDLPKLSVREQEQVNEMQLTWAEAHNLEQSTRREKESVEELRRLHLTSRFKEICQLKPGRSHAEHLIFKIQKGRVRPKTEQIEEVMKREALWEYCRKLCVNWYPCGLVVHPNAPWLGALPDGLVYDINEKFTFGLVHVKCSRFQNFIECKFLVCQDGVLQIRRAHPYYWQIQAEMMVTGTLWCDLLVLCSEDMLVQRIYRDKALITSMKKKLDDFFFYYYLPSLV